MVDSCHLNPLKCLNDGKCIENIPLNTSYCLCDSCHEGILCETDNWVITQFYTNYVFLIIYSIGFCLSILNNGLVPELFICSGRIRNTNCGIYLMVYSILSLVSSSFLLVHEAVIHYQNQLGMNTDQYVVFNCYVAKIGYHAFATFCIFLSSCIAFERGLIICFESKMNGSRWRPCVVIIVLFGIAGGSATPLFVYNCQWQNMRAPQIARIFLSWFFIVAGIVVYLLATLLVLISFARRIRRYGMENGSYIKTFLKLLYTHLFIFVPPIAYGISRIPFAIIYHTKDPKHLYLQCGISTGEYIIKVSAEELAGVPTIVTWLLFVYPSRVYMTEFYLNTWSGQCLAKILLLFKPYNGREESNNLSTTNPINNEDDNRELTRHRRDRRDSPP